MFDNMPKWVKGLGLGTIPAAVIGGWLIWRFTADRSDLTLGGECIAVDYPPPLVEQAGGVNDWVWKLFQDLKSHMYDIEVEATSDDVALYNRRVHLVDKDGKTIPPSEEDEKIAESAGRYMREHADRTRSKLTSLFPESPLLPPEKFGLLTTTYEWPKGVCHFELVNAGNKKASDVQVVVPGAVSFKVDRLGKSVVGLAENNGIKLDSLAGGEAVKLDVWARSAPDPSVVQVLSDGAQGSVGLKRSVSGVLQAAAAFAPWAFQVVPLLLGLVWWAASAKLARTRTIAFREGQQSMRDAVGRMHADERRQLDAERRQLQLAAGVDEALESEPESEPAPAPAPVRKARKRKSSP